MSRRHHPSVPTPVGSLRQAQLSRRTLLSTAARGGVGLAAFGGIGALLDACGGSSKSSSPAPAAGGSSAGGGSAPASGVSSLGTVDFQLGWVENVGYAGSYIASSRGYYRNHGVDVTIHPGGPSVSGMPLLVAGKRLVAISDPPTVSQAISQGADVKVVGAGYQSNPACIMSLAKNPIRTPADLRGKKIGVGASDNTEWQAFLKVNGIKPSEVTTLPAGFDPSPLTAGVWDGYLAFQNNEPPQFQAKGIATAVLPFGSFGLPSMNEVYTVTGATLKDPAARKKVVAFFAGEIEGWNVMVKNPELGTQLTVDVYGKKLGLDSKGELLAGKVTNAITVSADTKAHGLFYMSPNAIEQTVHTLSLTGVKAGTSMFDTSVLAEAYPLVHTT